MTSTAIDDTDPDVTAELDALNDRQAAAQAATARAHEELAAAKAARGDAIIDGTITAQHVQRHADARDELEECQEVEAALARRHRTLADESPAAHSASGDTRTARVRVRGRFAHACNQPSTGRKLAGGDELDMAAEDVLSLVAGGYVDVLTTPLPSWWPRGMPAVLEDPVARAFGGR